MKNIFILFRKGIKNPVIIYLLSRYGTYIIQFINSLFIAVYLGPYYLGIWGFINLVIGYISQFNLGIPHSVNVIISIRKQDKEYIQKIVRNGISMVLCLSIVIILFFQLSKIGIYQIGSKYNFKEYLLPITLIAILTHFNSLLSSVLRVFSKIHIIAVNQSLYPLFVLFVIPFFKEESLIWAILLTHCLALAISFLLYILQTPLEIKPLLEWNIIKYIQVKGWYLFIYNTSFYLILLSTKSFISSYYSVSEFGYFTFAYSLANVVLLLFNSISFLIFPKILNRFAIQSNAQVSILLTNIRKSYITLSHLLIHFIIMFFPLFLYFFPDYSESLSAFTLTALTVVLYTNSFGYQGLLLAKGKEKLIGFIALGVLLLNIVLSAILVYIVKVSFHFVILSTLTSYFVYVLIIGKYGTILLKSHSSLYSIAKQVFPWRMMLPFCISLLLIFLKAASSFYIIPFICFIILNYKDIISLKVLVSKVLEDSNFIHI